MRHIPNKILVSVPGKWSIGWWQQLQELGSPSPGNSYKKPGLNTAHLHQGWPALRQLRKKRPRQLSLPKSKLQNSKLPAGIIMDPSQAEARVTLSLSVQELATGTARLYLWPALLVLLWVKDLVSKRLSPGRKLAQYHPLACSVRLELVAHSSGSPMLLQHSGEPPRPPKG